VIWSLGSISASVPLSDLAARRVVLREHRPVSAIQRAMHVAKSQRLDAAAQVGEPPGATGTRVGPRLMSTVWPSSSIITPWRINGVRERGIQDPEAGNTQRRLSPHHSARPGWTWSSTRQIAG
jgi:hypothetical protein